MECLHRGMLSVCPNILQVAKHAHTHIPMQEACRSQKTGLFHRTVILYVPWNPGSMLIPVLQHNMKPLPATITMKEKYKHCSCCKQTSQQKTVTSRFSLCFGPIHYVSCSLSISWVLLAHWLKHWAMEGCEFKSQHCQAWVLQQDT